VVSSVRFEPGWSGKKEGRAFGDLSHFGASFSSVPRHMIPSESAFRAATIKEDQPVDKPFSIQITYCDD
jgi:hypothetical protein